MSLFRHSNRILIYKKLTIFTYIDKKKKHYKRLLIRKALLSKMPIQKKYLNICTSHEHKHSFYYLSFNKSG